MSETANVGPCPTSHGGRRHVGVCYRCVNRTRVEDWLPALRAELAGQPGVSDLQLLVPTGRDPYLAEANLAIVASGGRAAIRAAACGPWDWPAWGLAVNCEDTVFGALTAALLEAGVATTIAAALESLRPAVQTAYASAAALGERL
jgi:hypothetical protein